MTTTVATPIEPTLQQEVGRGALFRDVMRSEWTKIRTVRSTFWTLLAAVVAMIGIAVIASEVVVHQWSSFKPEDKAAFNPIELGLAGAFFAQLAIGVLGVLVITTEYGTGMIRATFAAVPQRRLVLGAKALVFFLVSLVVGVASSFVAFFTAELILGTYGPEKLNASITDPGALRAVVGAGVFLAMMGLLGLAVGAVLRRSAGAITALFALVFFLPGLMELLPHSIKDNVNKFLPSNAGTAIYRQLPGPDVLSPGAGLLVLLAYAIGALAVAAVIVQRRDT
jgi:ABC-type transport system involved in multi-copper enzyme maturation permease subunit